jgi:hypothetical protein
LPRATVYHFPIDHQQYKCEGFDILGTLVATLFIDMIISFYAINFNVVSLFTNYYYYYYYYFYRFFDKFLVESFSLFEWLNIVFLVNVLMVTIDFHNTSWFFVNIN